MLNIKIICVGKIKEKSLQELIFEYQKRLSKYCKLEIIEVDDEKLPLNYSIADAQKIKEKECNKIKEKLNKIGKSSIIFLDLSGKQYTSEEFSDKINNMCTYGTSTITFVIGGSLGMTKELLSLSDNKISFSKMTFPHQLFRVFLLEQIFRAFKIQNNETYHH